MGLQMLFVFSKPKDVDKRLQPFAAEEVDKRLQSARRRLFVIFNIAFNKYTLYQFVGCREDFFIKTHSTRPPFTAETRSNREKPSKAYLKITRLEFIILLLALHHRDFMMIVCLCLKSQVSSCLKVCDFSSGVDYKGDLKLTLASDFWSQND
ncbi:hypothetical protein LXL04_018808 [Taraxacum kok-saghyz]